MKKSPTTLGHHATIKAKKSSAAEIRRTLRISTQQIRVAKMALSGVAEQLEKQQGPPRETQREKFKRPTTSRLVKAGAEHLNADELAVKVKIYRQMIFKLRLAKKKRREGQKAEAARLEAVARHLRSKLARLRAREAPPAAPGQDPARANKNE